MGSALSSTSSLWLTSLGVGGGTSTMFGRMTFNSKSLTRSSLLSWFRSSSSSSVVKGSVLSRSGNVVRDTSANDWVSLVGGGGGGCDSVVVRVLSGVLVACGCDVSASDISSSFKIMTEALFLSFRVTLLFLFVPFPSLVIVSSKSVFTFLFFPLGSAAAVAAAAVVVPFIGAGYCQNGSAAMRSALEAPM